MRRGKVRDQRSDFLNLANLPFPEEFRRTLDLGRETLVDRAIERGVFEQRTLRCVCRQRDVNFRRQTDNSSRRVLRHFLAHFHGHSFDIEAMLLRSHREDRAHASTQRGRDEIGGRKCLAFSFVIRRRIGRNGGVGWTVDRIAMKIAGVFDGDVDHV